MQHVRETPNIKGWGLLNVDALEEICSNAVNEAIQLAFSYEDTRPYFPIEYSRPNGSGSDGYNGDEVTDPLTVYLQIGFEHGDKRPTYSFNVRSALDQTIAECEKDGSWSYGLSRIAEAFRKLADDIDEAVAKGNSTPAA